MEGSTAGVISADSDNIVDLVREQYEKITTSIKVVSNSTETGCPSRITSECEGGGNECKNVTLGTAKEFELHLRLTGCRGETFEVSPVGINDRMIVEVEPICECPCLDEPRPAVLSPECSSHGWLSCGVCQCDVGFFGPRCNCSVVENDSEVDPGDLEASCKPANSSIFTPVCSGRGECVCGRCECDDLREGIEVSGEFCDNVSNMPRLSRGKLTQELKFLQLQRLKLGPQSDSMLSEVFQ